MSTEFDSSRLLKNLEDYAAELRAEYDELRHKYRKEQAAYQASQDAKRNEERQLAENRARVAKLELKRKTLNEQYGAQLEAIATAQQRKKSWTHVLHRTQYNRAHLRERCKMTDQQVKKSEHALQIVTRMTEQAQTKLNATLKAKQDLELRMQHDQNERQLVLAKANAQLESLEKIRKARRDREEAKQLAQQQIRQKSDVAASAIALARARSKLSTARKQDQEQEEHFKKLQEVTLEKDLNKIGDLFVQRREAFEDVKQKTAAELARSATLRAQINELHEKVGVIEGNVEEHDGDNTLDLTRRAREKSTSKVCDALESSLRKAQSMTTAAGQEHQRMTILLASIMDCATRLVSDLEIPLGDDKLEITFMPSLFAKLARVLAAHRDEYGAVHRSPRRNNQSTSAEAAVDANANADADADAEPGGDDTEFVETIPDNPFALGSPVFGEGEGVDELASSKDFLGTQSMDEGNLRVRPGSGDIGTATLRPNTSPEGSGRGHGRAATQKQKHATVAEVKCKLEFKDRNKRSSLVTRVYNKTALLRGGRGTSGRLDQEHALCPDDGFEAMRRSAKQEALHFIRANVPKQVSARKQQMTEQQLNDERRAKPKRNKLSPLALRLLADFTSTTST